MRTDIADILRVVLFIAGIAFVGYGSWLIYEPAGYIVSGLMMFSPAVIGAYRAGAPK